MSLSFKNVFVDLRSSVLNIFLLLMFVENIWTIHSIWFSSRIHKQTRIKVIHKNVIQGFNDVKNMKVTFRVTFDNVIVQKTFHEKYVA